MRPALKLLLIKYDLYNLLFACFDGIFRDIKKDLVRFYGWFMGIVPECILDLEGAVRGTSGYEGWSANGEVNSLLDLGIWFSTQVGGMRLDQDEIFILKKKMQFLVEVQDWDLDEKTKSMAVRVGMYYGSVALKNNPDLKWEQLLGNKRLADYGQPVLAGPGFVSINPVRVAHSFACGLVDGSRQGGRLREVYENWAELRMPL